MTETGENQDTPESGGFMQKSEGRAPAFPGDMPPIGYALMRVNRVLIFRNNPVPELSALPMAQLRLLWTVRHMADATMKDFSERLEVSQSTVTQLADHLIKRKFVERYADENDRRVVRLKLSEFGAEVLEMAEKDGRDRMNDVWEALSDEDRAKVLIGLELLGAAAEAVSEQMGRPLPPLPFHPNVKRDANPDDDSGAQPVVDLMTRRVRGQS